MRTNPFLDTFMWLTDVRWETALYWALLLGSLALVRINWRADPAQRTAQHATIWMVRVLIGSMWYQGSTWKLPLPFSDAFKFWLEQSGKYASFDALGALVNGFMLPAIAFFGSVAYVVELFLAAALILGVCVRLAGLVAIGQCVFLWLTLYRAEHEWPWNYMFLMMLHVMFIVVAAGRSLGWDAVLRRPGGLAGRISPLGLAT